ncbi:MAG: nuclear transport factor 2 family protein [Nitrospira sp.]|nr:nuclear transport factor 2 family protein [Nitrospira sp.]
MFQRGMAENVVWAGVGLLLALSVQACSSKKPFQYPADHERIQMIDQAVEALREAYQEKNISAFRSLLQPDQSLDRLRGEVQADFEAFETIRLEFKIERMVIEGSDTDVYVHWQGVWKKKGEEMGARQRGSARLQWTGSTSPLLRGVQGDLPFGMTIKQTLSESFPSQPVLR